MSAAVVPRITEVLYLENERRAATKSEFVDGDVLAMAGATEPHNDISLNVASEIRFQLKRRPCKVYNNDMRVRVDATGAYTYPDVVAVCGARAFLDDTRDTLLNPTVIVEVLSESTERYDRSEKFAHYRRLPSLADYVLIAQNKILIEHYTRGENATWILHEISEPDGVLALPSIGVVLSVEEIYDKVQFRASATEESKSARSLSEIE